MAAETFQLSPEQERVVIHRGEHFQVIACAGAGKTEAISRHVLSLIVDGVEPFQIIAFTFTDRAARRWVTSSEQSERFRTLGLLAMP